MFKKAFAGVMLLMAASVSAEEHAFNIEKLNEAEGPTAPKGR